MDKRSLLLILILASPALAQTKRPLSINDVWNIRRVGNPTVSRDGAQIAYTVSTYDMKENQSNADIFVRELGADAARMLTSNSASDTSPAFSPDGESIAFVSKREGDKVAQLYLISTHGGEARRLTDMPMAVSAPRFMPDGKRVAFVSTLLFGYEPIAGTKLELETREKKLVKAKITENRIYRHWDTWLTDKEQMRLFIVEIETGKLTDVLFGWKGLFDISGENQTIDYDISSDGKWIAISADAVPPPYFIINQDVFLVAADGGTRRNLTADNPAEDSSPVFSPDGKTLAFGRETKAQGFPDRTRLTLLDIATGKTTVLTENWDNVPSDWRFTDDGQTLVFRAEVRGRTGIYSMPVGGGTPKEIVRGGMVGGFELSPKNQILFSMSNFDAPPEIFSLPVAGGTPAPVSKVNDEFMKAFDLGKIEDMTFAGAEGEAVQMYVCYPPNFDPAKKWPLVQMIHGGPIGTFGDGFSFRWNPHLFAAPGYVVAMVNFHGSSSFGQKWVESILGAHPDKPFTDIMKATDFLIGKGFIDEHRLAAAGGSYGGFMVNWIAGHTDRFAALVSHAGVFSLTAQMASDSTEGRQFSYGGFPFTNLANVEKWSPNRFSEKFTTPMLVTHGERDFRVPVGQGLELYGVLTAKGVPARLVYFPDENHWILKGQNSVLWYSEVLGWLSRWFAKGR